MSEERHENWLQTWGRGIALVEAQKRRKRARRKKAVMQFSGLAWSFFMRPIGGEG